jgi:hypothetical protein
VLPADKDKTAADRGVGSAAVMMMIITIFIGCWFFRCSDTLTGIALSFFASASPSSHRFFAVRSLIPDGRKPVSAASSSLSSALCFRQAIPLTSLPRHRQNGKQPEYQACIHT